MAQIDLLMASPMKRTIQTCQLSFAPAVERGHKILLMPLAQEGSDTPMDTGSSEESIREAFGDLVDTQRLETHPYWNTNTGRFGTEGDVLIWRAQQLRQVIRDRPEKNIALVSHGQFAHYIVGNVSKDGNEQTTRMWENTECRSYEFVSGDDEEAQIKETEDSKGERGDLEKKSEGYVTSASGHRKNSAGAPVSP